MVRWDGTATCSTRAQLERNRIRRRERERENWGLPSQGPTTERRLVIGPGGDRAGQKRLGKKKTDLEDWRPGREATQDWGGRKGRKENGTTERRAVRDSLEEELTQNRIGVGGEHEETGGSIRGGWKWGKETKRKVRQDQETSEKGKQTDFETREL